MTKYLTAHEVLDKVEGLNSLSTLNKWANFIQKECTYSFHYDYLPFVSYSKRKNRLNHRKTRVFSMEEIQKFQKVVELIPTLGRDSSLRKQFDSQYRLETMKNSELMTEIIKQVEERLKEPFQVLTQQYQRLERQYQASEQRLAQLEETLTTQEQTSSGWFRRKR